MRLRYRVVSDAPHPNRTPGVLGGVVFTRRVDADAHAARLRLAGAPCHVVRDQCFRGTWVETT